jgi:hypothetical protein
MGRCANLRLLCRCTSLQTAHFTYTTAFRRSIFHFQGQGTTPSERRAHLQAQLAMLPASPLLLAPPSWPACNCLTHLEGEFASNPHSSMQLSAAMQTASLRSLHVTFDGEATSSILSGLSNLHRLTDLCISVSSSSTLPVLAAIAALANLQTLSLCAVHRAAEESHSSLDIPPSWSQLARLTQLHMWAFNLDLRQLSVLPAVKLIHLEEVTVVTGDLASMLPLTCLTSLRWLPSACFPGADQQPTSCAGGVVPAAWRERLQTLEWSVRDSFCIPVVAQLAGLVDLELHSVEVTPELCR